MKALVDAHHIEANRALCGRGKFMLAPSHAKHRLTVDRWKGMTAGQRRKASDACFKLATYAECMQQLDGRHADSRVNARRWQKTAPAQTQAGGKKQTLSL